MQQKGEADLAESALNVWRRTLKNDPEQASLAIDAVIGEMERSKNFSAWDLDAYRSQMKNGVHPPGCFGAGKRA